MLSKSACGFNRLGIGAYTDHSNLHKGAEEFDPVSQHPSKHVYDAGTTLNQHRLNTPRLQGQGWPRWLYDLNFQYCRSGSIREILILASFARRTNLRIQESPENYYYYSASEVK